jgi:hypothetical protein
MAVVVVTVVTTVVGMVVSEVVVVVVCDTGGRLVSGEVLDKGFVLEIVEESLSVFVVVFSQATKIVTIITNKNNIEIFFIELLH